MLYVLSCRFNIKKNCIRGPFPSLIRLLYRQALTELSKTEKMKKYLVSVFFLVALFLQDSAFAQSNPQRGDTMARFYNRLAASSNASDKARLENLLYDLLKSEQERDWMTARRFFGQLKKTGTADSLTNALLAKFPAGLAAREIGTKEIYDEKDAVKKEKLYKAWIKKFPPENFGSDRIQYDYVRNAVATAYAQADNVKKAIEYANMTETPAWKGEGWAGPASVFLEKGYYKEAAELFRKARDVAFKAKTTNRNDPGAAFTAIGYPGYSRSLVTALMKLKNYDEALPYAKEMYDSSKTIDGQISETYALALMGVKQDQRAFEIIDQAVQAGAGTQEMKNALKLLYPKIKGSSEGYDAYIANINKLLAEKIRKDVAKQIINLPAPNFVLKDVDGNTVSLEDLKGKVVVLDFWATWCAPCKKSFPAMKMAMERLKDHPNVRFLYIHTMERDSNATASARKYVTENKFPFQVLMDLKNQAGVNEVVSSYKVSGIPTKFIIDPQGNIRFRVLGFSGGEDAAVEEVVAMVELAGK